jgi:hypothetical protein
MTLIFLNIIYVVTVKKFCDIYRVLMKALEADSLQYQSSNSDYPMVGRRHYCRIVTFYQTILVLSYNGISWMDNIRGGLGPYYLRNKKK